jgi:hypothetical protein
LTPGTPRDRSSARLRREVRSKGRFVHRGDDYLRVLVPRRFVMHVERSDGLLHAARLTPRTRRRAGKRAASTSRRPKKRGAGGT